LFTFDVLLNLALPLVMVVDHRNKTPETMEVLQNEWNAQGLVRIAPLHRSFEINRVKMKLEMLNEFDERIEDLEKYKKTHGRLSVNRHEDGSLYQLFAGVRHSLNQFEKDDTRKLTEERIARLDALGFEWLH